MASVEQLVGITAAVAAVDPDDEDAGPGLVLVVPSFARSTVLAQRRLLPEEGVGP